jgi:hypothetical protein
VGQAAASVPAVLFYLLGFSFPGILILQLLLTLSLPVDVFSYLSSSEMNWTKMQTRARRFFLAGRPPEHDLQQSTRPSSVTPTNTEHSAQQAAEEAQKLAYAPNLGSSAAAFVREKEQGRFNQARERA